MPLSLPKKALLLPTIKSDKIEDKVNLHFTVSDTGIGIDGEASGQNI